MPDVASSLSTCLPSYSSSENESSSRICMGACSSKTFSRIFIQAYMACGYSFWFYKLRKFSLGAAFVAMSVINC